jgi:glycogen debranching enzyme
VPLPSVAIDDPCYSDRETWWGRHRHWRGPSWVNSAWLVSLGLRRLGLGEEADLLARRLADVMGREGFREYYESRSGRGMGAHDFGWSTLIVELLDPSVT